MKKNNSHIVNRVNLEINTPNKEKAFELKNKIDSFLKDHLFPELELLFNEISTPDQIRRFETVQLDFELQHTEELDFLAEKFSRILNSKLSVIDNQQSSYNSNKITNKQGSPVLPVRSVETTDKQAPKLPSESVVNHYNNLKNTFIHFLETGRLPWYAAAELLHEFVQPMHFKEALGDFAFLDHLKALFKNHPESLERFVAQFGTETVEILISSLPGLYGKTPAVSFASGSPKLQSLTFELMIAKLIGLEPEEYGEKWEKLQSAIKGTFKTKSEQNRFEKQVTELFTEIGFSTNEFRFGEKQNQTPPITNKNKEKLLTDNHEIYVRNAGLILAHPFLNELLKRADCLDNQNLLRADRQDYAVHLLHFLCTGLEMPMEHELTFEKFICGLPVSRPVVRNMELSEEDKTECNELLNSIIENWTALKNTSAEGLRQNFFLRNGKLDLHQSPVKLYVERNTIDILLEKLPWSVSVVKLPWINDLIFIEW